MNSNYVVYKHVSPSDQVYIGITCQNPKRRWLNGKGYKHNMHFTNAINKYGWDNFQHIIIAKGLTEDEAKWLEIQLIDVYDSTNRHKGYNVSPGGNTVSDETRQILKEKTSGENNPMYGRKGKLNPMYGKNIKDCMSEENYEAWKERQRDVMLERNLVGDKNPMYGRCGKDSPRARAVICITTMRVFDSTKEAAEYYHIKQRSDITRCCKGKRQSCGKYNGQKLVWRYLDIKEL